MIMLDTNPIFSELRGTANIQLNRLLKDMEASDAEAGAMTIKIRVGRKKAVVPETPELSRMAVVPEFEWKVTNSIPIRNEFKGMISIENAEIVIGEDESVHLERIRTGQMHLSDLDDEDEEGDE
jgi:hypothetical protein